MKIPLVLLATFSLVLSAFAQEKTAVLPQSSETQPTTFLQKLYFEAGGGPVAFPKKLVSSVEDGVTNSRGFWGGGHYQALGLNLTRHVSLGAEFNGEKVSGKFMLPGAAIDPQLSSMPNSELALTLRMRSLAGTATWNFFPRKKFGLYLGGGLGRTCITHRVRGFIPVDFDEDTGAIVTEPIDDRGTDCTLDGTGRGGFSFRIHSGLEANVGYSFLDTHKLRVGVKINPFGLFKKSTY